MTEPHVNETLAFLAGATAGAHKLRPALVGPTGSGKTARVKQLAADLGRPCHTLLLAHMTAEDLGGLPRVEGQSVVAHPFDWARRAAEVPHVLFLDEVDKARLHTLGAALTLLWELEAGPIRLHPETIIILGMQPVDAAMFLADETGKAISARAVFIPVDYDYGYLQSATGIDYSFLDEILERPKAPKPPTLPYPSTRQLHQLTDLLRAAWTHFGPERWEPVARTIAAGVVPLAAVDRILEAVSSSLAPHKLAGSDLVAALNDGLLLPADLEPQDCAAIIDALALNATPGRDPASDPSAAINTWASAIYKVAEAGDRDAWSGLFRANYEAIKEACQQHGNSYDLFGEETTEEHFTLAVRALAAAVGALEICRARGWDNPTATIISELLSRQRVWASEDTAEKLEALATQVANRASRED